MINKLYSEKVILTDADGVLLDWAHAFDSWMHRHGYTIDGEEDNYKISAKYGILNKDAKRLVRMFNESAWMRKLPPHKDAIKYVKKLHEEGWVFHVITSQSDDQYAQHLRIKNLREMFGDTVFERYVILDTGADKNEALKEYKDSGCYWIEDKKENALLGHEEFGLEGILMAHSHNADFEHESIPRVANWKEIYEKISGV